MSSALYPSSLVTVCIHWVSGQVRTVCVLAEGSSNEWRPWEGGAFPAGELRTVFGGGTVFGSGEGDILGTS